MVIKKQEFYFRTNLDYFKALDFEKYYRYEEACKYYELAITKEDKHVSPEMYINLAFIYWRASKGYTQELKNYIFTFLLGRYGNIRYSEIIEEGLKRFNNCFELHFWKIYFEYYNPSEEYEGRDRDFMIKVDELAKTISIDDYQQLNHYRTLGFKPEYLLYYQCAFDEGLTKFLPDDYQIELEKLKSFTLNPKTSKNRFIQEWLNS